MGTTILVLPLANMAERHWGLTEAVAEVYLEAARVCLHRHHTSPSEFTIRTKASNTEAMAQWEAPDERTCRAWAEDHTESEHLAAEAEIAARAGQIERAQELYTQAAEAEGRALEHIDPSKKRTLGITAVSAVSLLYKARQYTRAELLAYRLLST